MRPTRTLRLVALACLCALAAPPTFAGEADNRAAGDVLRPLTPAVALAITLIERDLEGTRQLGWVLGTTLMATEALKRTFNGTAWGERPNGGEYAFPSGHVSTTCAPAAFVQRRYGAAWAAPLYAAAAFTAYSRVDADRHRWRDVIAGCALAVGAAAWLTTPRDDPSVKVAPLLDGGRVVGLRIGARF